MSHHLKLSRSLSSLQVSDIDFPSRYPYNEASTIAISTKPCSKLLVVRGKGLFSSSGFKIMGSLLAVWSLCELGRSVSVQSRWLGSALSYLMGFSWVSIGHGSTLSIRVELLGSW
ncbi:hypothetical protein Ancab_014248, partial [Ancistrocladus abbreviatus]